MRWEVLRWEQIVVSSSTEPSPKVMCETRVDENHRGQSGKAHRSRVPNLTRHGAIEMRSLSSGQEHAACLRLLSSRDGEESDRQSQRGKEARKKTAIHIGQ